jgi:Fe-S cluster assembly ATPase SufC
MRTPMRKRDRTYLYQLAHALQGNAGSEDALRDLAGAVIPAIRGVHVCRWTPSMLALPAAIDPSRKSRLEENGFGLTQLLDEIMNNDRQAFTALESRFFKIFNQFDALKLVVTDKAFRANESNNTGTVKLQESAGKKLVMRRRDGTEVAASQLSDGTLIVLAYLAILYAPQPPAFLLIEEPENGIHPARIDDVIKILKELVFEQGKTQVILTTHSSYVVNLFSPEEVTLCRMDDSGEVSVRRLSDSPLVQKQEGYFTLGEIWVGEGDERLSNTAQDATAT